jgi:hypothetical protein
LKLTLNIMGAQDKGHWWRLVNTVMKIWVPFNSPSYLAGWLPVSFSRRSQPTAVSYLAGWLPVSFSRRSQPTAVSYSVIMPFIHAQSRTCCSIECYQLLRVSCINCLRTMHNVCGTHKNQCLSVLHNITWSDVHRRLRAWQPCCLMHNAITLPCHASK